MFTQIDINQRRAGNVQPSGQLPVYPPLVELMFTLGIPHVTQFKNYLMVADIDGFKLITLDEYFSQAGPPYEPVYLFMCTDDATYPNECKVVHFVARIQGISRSNNLDELGPMCTTYLTLLSRPGLSPNLERFNEPELINVSTPVGSDAWVENMIFRPSYDLAYAAPTMSETMSVKWSREGNLMIFQGFAAGSSTPAVETQILASFMEATELNNSSLNGVYGDDLMVGSLKAILTGDILMQKISLFSFFAYVVTAGGAEDLCWLCLQRRSLERTLWTKFLVTKDPTRPLDSIKPATDAAFTAVSVASTNMYISME